MMMKPALYLTNMWNLIFIVPAKGRYSTQIPRLPDKQMSNAFHLSNDKITTVRQFLIKIRIANIS